LAGGGEEPELEVSELLKRWDDQDMTFAIVVEKAKANHAAYVPDLPGCVATGKTVKETERRIREAIEVHVEGLREDGLPVPKPSSVVD
jgi:predicted RNase H-like HicB family nuclease